MSTRLLYVVDPMCSWCYGFAPSLEAVRANLREGVSMDLVMGGLAPDSDVPMDPETRGYVQHAWRAVESTTGVPFNQDFWTQCKPRRSTYPSCRAVIIARRSGLEWQMLKAIQSAYYTEARNPSDVDTLIALASTLGLNVDKFATELSSKQTQTELAADFNLRQQLAANSFPSIAIQKAGTQKVLCTGYLPPKDLTATFTQANLLRQPRG